MNTVLRAALSVTVAVAAAGSLAFTTASGALATPAPVKAVTAESGYQTTFKPNVSNPTTASAAELAAAGGNTADSLAMMSSSSTVGGSISRTEVIRRAQSWVDAGVPYSMYAYRTDANGQYRTDCSGFVSMAWNLPSSSSNNWGETTTTLPGFSSVIAKESLKPGDILLNTAAGSSGHVVIFNGWANAEHTAYHGLEEAGSTGAVSRTIPYPYFSGHGTFNPYRYDNIVDTVAPPMAVGVSPIIGVGDINRTGVADFLARDTDGRLYSYMGKGDGTFTGRSEIGGGWNQYDMIVGAGDINKTGVPDLLARDKTTGHLFSYMGIGDGTFSGRTDLGGGWDEYDMIVGSGDMNGTGVADIIARDRAGDLWIYMGIGDGKFTGRTKIGFGFGIYDSIIGVGDINKTGVPDLIARDKTTGHLYSYMGKGDGTLSSRTDLGGGWDQYTALTGPGDINSTGVADLVVRDANGDLYTYMGIGDGTFTGRTKAGYGYNTYA